MEPKGFFGWTRADNRFTFEEEKQTGGDSDADDMDYRDFGCSWNGASYTGRSGGRA